MTEAVIQHVIARHITLLRKTSATLSHVLANVDLATARRLRDRDDGWTILEIVCHLRDFETVFRERARQIRDDANPALAPVDHEALAIERAYNQQDLAVALADLEAARLVTVDFFKSLTTQQWSQAGIHPENGVFTLLDALMQIGHHDVNHLEQITRVLRQPAAS